MLILSFKAIGPGVLEKKIFLSFHRAPDKRGYPGLFKDDFFLFLNKNISYDPSLKPSLRDSSNEGSQDMFLWGNKENYL